MNGTTPSSHSAAEADDTRQKRRLILGVAVFASGWVLALALVPIVSASGLPTAMKATISGLLVLGLPKVFLVAAIAIMGKPGFQYLKSVVGSHFKRLAPAAEVSPLRYRIGLILLVSMIVLGNLGPYVQGLLPGVQVHRQVYAAAGDMLMLLSLFILGGDFWDKLRALFVREAKVSFPGKG